MATATQIRSIYQDELGRTPGQEEVAYWVSTGLDAAGVRANIGASQEAVNYRASRTIEREFDNPASPRTLAEDVVAIYQSELGRTPSADEIAYWTSQGLTREGIQSNVAASQEAQARRQQGVPLAALPNDERRRYIEEVYRTHLGRPADEEGLRYWYGTDLSGVDLINQMRHSAGLDSELYQDAAFAAFERMRAHREGQIESEREYRGTQIDSQRRLAGSLLDRQQDIGLRQVDRDFESRGLYHSSGRTDARGDVLTDIGLNRQTQELQFAQQRADVNRQAAIDLANLSRQRDEEEVAARQRLSNRSLEAYANAQQ